MIPPVILVPEDLLKNVHLVILQELDTYMKDLVLLHAQTVTMPKQLTKHVNHVIPLAIPVMVQMQMTVNLVLLQDTTFLLHILV